jgi:hypothetical protein
VDVYLLCLFITGDRLTCPGDPPTSGDSRTLLVGVEEDPSSGLTSRSAAVRHSHV